MNRSMTNGRDGQTKLTPASGLSVSHDKSSIRPQVGSYADNVEGAHLRVNIISTVFSGKMRGYTSRLI